MNLSPAQIAGYAAAAGFPDPVMAAAVALAESSGNPAAVGDDGDSIGLWQINLPNHPEFAGANLNDPQTNANAAFAIYSAAGSRFTPWSTFNSGAYQKYLAVVAAANASLTPSVAMATPAFTPSTSVMTLFPTNYAGNLPPSSDSSGIIVALALAAGVLFAFSEI